MSVYKEDLQEFSRTIVADTSAVIKDKVVDKFHNQDSQNKTKSKANAKNHLQARILRIQRDPKTYLFSPPLLSSSLQLGLPSSFSPFSSFAFFLFIFSLQKV